MHLPHVAVGSLGGTITMTRRPAGQGVLPTLGAQELIAAVPQLAEIAHIEATTLASLPGASLSFHDLIAALEWAEAAADGGASGVVLIQGTDTLEETAFFLDLFWDREEPLVMTGAMRPPATPGADGPANLLAGVLTAVSPLSSNAGVVVVMNDVIHAASRVRKSDATGTNAFTSPSFGPLGRVHEGVVTYGNTHARIAKLPRPGREIAAAPRVALIETCLGDDARLLQLALQDGYDGVVVSAFGAGHVPRALADAIEAATEQVPVVFASRTGSGSTLAHTYGFPGSESDLLRRGAVSGGWLDARKARLLLWALLATGVAADGVAAQFEQRSGSVLARTADNLR
ncbi:asparaginase [Georgenia soli]|uniref:Asparaginase n=1 Tax=Georgenia soli TaxID=638953 RepID=A0A2A9ELA2_9MICO|nr:asparaginase [Georgenia soli]PFG39042.1 asparaginase [Georgenia soli]